MDVYNSHTGFTKQKDELGTYCQKLFQDFIETYCEDNTRKYLELCHEFEKMERNSLEVSFDDVEKFNSKLTMTIVNEFFRVYPFLCEAVANVVKDNVDPKTTKKFFVSFIDVPTHIKLRQLNSCRVSQLIKITAQVVRTHPVHPELMYGTFVCLDCNTINPDIEQQFKFTIPTICRNPVCNNRTKFELDIDNSKFVDFQKVKVQEIQEQLPRGSIPRTLDIILRAEIVETVQSGDQYEFCGTLITVPDVAVLSFAGAKAEMKTRSKIGTGENVTDGVRGLKALGVRHLNYRFAFFACSAVPSNQQFFNGDFRSVGLTVTEMRKYLTDAEWNKIYEMSKDPKIYEKLLESLFPSIHGNEQVKKGILLMLFGGVAKKTMEGTSLRGDINCCIVGDPSTAKSQMLKQVAEFSPRAIYTSGKASSAAGLTAAVIMDEETGEFVIEAGAILLADNGICCIDEFDKMDPRDQVAIHESMEQQTISIAKAGVRATLNARTSILAAANPIGGRYDRSKSLQMNVSLTAPIMSRFDLFFVLVDEGNELLDYTIAQKILDLHTNKVQTTNILYTREDILRYIIFAKHFKPTLTEEASKLLVDLYIQLRQRDTQSSSKSTWRITVRQLESMIRLSEAMAKMKCSDDVTEAHVREAYGLLDKSIIRVEQPDINLDGDMEEALGSEEEQPNPCVNTERPRKKKITLSPTEYENMAEAITIFIRKEEEKQTENDDGASTFEGVRRSRIIEHYLTSMQNEIESEEELNEKAILFEKVLERLIYVDQIFIPVAAKNMDGDDDPYIVVHPNYNFD